MLQNYLTTAWRSIKRHYSYALINTFGLMLSICCCIVIYIFVRYETSFDAFHTDADRIYRVVHEDHTADGVQYWNTTAYTLAAALRNDFPGIEVAQAAGPMTRLISAEEGGKLARHEVDKLLFVDPYYLQLFNFKNAFKRGSIWLEGNPATAFDKVNAAVITLGLAQKYFPQAIANGESLLGKNLLLNNKDPLEITGVLNNPPANTTLLFDLLVSYQFFALHDPYRANNWSGNYQGSTYIKLSRSWEAQSFEEQLPTFKKKYLNEDDDRRITYRLQHLREIHNSKAYGTSIGSYVVTPGMISGLVTIAIFLIIIASVNYVNLSMVQSIRRSREIGIRKVLGGSRSSILNQFLLETFLLVLFAVVHGYAIAQLAIRELNQQLTMIHLSLTTGPELYGLLVAFVIILTLLAGFYPALFMSGYSPVTALEKKIPFGAKNRSRNVLVIVQFAIVQLLIVSTLVVSYQMDYFKTKDLGFDKMGIMTFNIPNQDSVKLRELENKLLDHHAIEKVSFSSGLPSAPNSQYGTDFRMAHELVRMQRSAEMKVVGLDYLDMYQLRLVAGRWLNESNVTPDNTFNGFVVNESLVEMLGKTPEEALGLDIIINEGQAPIVGVVKDFHNHTFHNKISPCLLFYWNVGFFTEGSIKMNAAANPVGIKNFVRSVWKEVYPSQIFQHQFIEDYLAKNYRIEALVLGACKIAAFIAILVGCLGLYGLSAFITEVRTKEIGVRRVLGATMSSIVSLLSGYFIRLLIVSILLGSVIALVLMKEWLSSFPYRMDLGIGIFVTGAFTTLLIALVTTGIKTVRAAMANPADSLRYE